MNKLILLAALAFTATIAVAPPAHADWHHGGGGVNLSIGVGAVAAIIRQLTGYYGYPSYYYVAPPPVVYVPPPTYYAAPAPAPAYYAPPQQAMPADQTSPTFTNQQGQTCREYQSSATVAGAPTAYVWHGLFADRTVRGRLFNKIKLSRNSAEAVRCNRVRS